MPKDDLNPSLTLEDPDGGSLEADDTALLEDGNVFGFDWDAVTWQTCLLYHLSHQQHQMILNRPFRTYSLR